MPRLSVQTEEGEQPDKRIQVHQEEDREQDRDEYGKLNYSFHKDCSTAYRVMIDHHAFVNDPASANHSFGGTIGSCR
jgi:hypothetical protein